MRRWLRKTGLFAGTGGKKAGRGDRDGAASSAMIDPSRLGRTQQPAYVSFAVQCSALPNTEVISGIVSELSALPPKVRPWECIHPQSAGGVPAFSSSGIYWVRLFWMGEWRKIVVV